MVDKCSQFWVEFISRDLDVYRVYENVYDGYGSRKKLLKQINHGQYSLTDLKKMKTAIEDFLTNPLLNKQASVKETIQ